jgi:hypothetical protein
MGVEANKAIQRRIARKVVRSGLGGYPSTARRGAGAVERGGLENR